VIFATALMLYRSYAEVNTYFEAERSFHAQQTQPVRLTAPVEALKKQVSGNEPETAAHKKGVSGRPF
jgi:hypothetical protein